MSHMAYAFGLTGYSGGYRVTHMTTATETQTLIYTCEADEDFALCDTCGRTTFDDWSRCDMSGDVSCAECDHAYMREMERACRGMYVPPTYEQLREDQAGFGSDDREFWKLETLISQLY